MKTWTTLLFTTLFTTLFAGCLYTSTEKATVFDANECKPCSDVESFWKKTLANVGVLVIQAKAPPWIPVNIQVADEKTGQAHPGVLISLWDDTTQEYLDTTFTDENGFAVFLVNASKPLYAITNVKPPNAKYAITWHDLTGMDLREYSSIQVYLSPAEYDPENVTDATHYHGPMPKGSGFRLPNGFTTYFIQFESDDAQAEYVARVFDDEGDFVDFWRMDPNQREVFADFSIQTLNETISKEGQPQLDINVTWDPQIKTSDTQCAVYDAPRETGAYTLRKPPGRQANQQPQNAADCYTHYKPALLGQNGCGVPGTRKALLVYADSPPERVNDLNDVPNLRFGLSFRCANNSKNNT